MLIVTALLGKILLSCKPSVLYSVCAVSISSDFSSQSPQVFCRTLYPDVALGGAYATRIWGSLSLLSFDDLVGI